MTLETQTVRLTAPEPLSLYFRVADFGPGHEKDFVAARNAFLTECVQLYDNYAGQVRAKLIDMEPSQNWPELPKAGQVMLIGTESMRGADNDAPDQIEVEKGSRAEHQDRTGRKQTKEAGNRHRARRPAKGRKGRTQRGAKKK